jgi:hypothetical protein
MKKLLLLLLLIQSTIVLAQVPQGFNYQATVRNSSGGLIINQNVNFKFNVMQNTPTSVPVFSETHFAPTDDLGAVNLVIGKGTATTGIFSNIDWGNGTYYLGIELNTGSGYVAMGTTQLLSVPYALYAKSSGTNASVGAISATSTVNGASITSGVLNLSPADASNGGIVTAGIQTLAGAKTFSSDLIVNGITIGRGAGNQEYNTILGHGANINNTTGIRNTANGYHALEANTTGNNNTAIGWATLISNTTGTSNDATGANALVYNTTGNANVAHGVEALRNNTTGSDNVANGAGSLGGNTTGSNNVANGSGALAANTTGEMNVAIGNVALLTNSVGSNNTVIGNRADVSVDGLTNATAIGNTARVVSSNTVQLGNTAVTSVNTSGNYTGKAFIKTGGTASQYLMADGSVSDAGSVSQNKGKPSIMISGNITNAQAAAKIAAEAGPSTENILIFDTTGLTTLDLSMVTSLYSLEIVGNANLTTINLSGLTEVFENGSISSNNALAALSFPALTSVYARSGFEIRENPTLTSISFPVLSKISRMSIGGDALSTLSFPMLTTIGSLNIGSPKLASIGLPLLTYSQYLALSGGALPSSQINAVLKKMLSVTPATGKNISLNGQTPPAPPTGQGIIDKTTLINAGNYVITD